MSAVNLTVDMSTVVLRSVNSTKLNHHDGTPFALQRRTGRADSRIRRHDNITSTFLAYVQLFIDSFIVAGFHPLHDI